MEVLGFQIFFFLLILISGIFGRKARNYVVVFSIIFTLIMVFMSWLIILQLFTIVLAYFISENYVGNSSERLNKIDDNYGKGCIIFIVILGISAIALKIFHENYFKNKPPETQKSETSDSSNYDINSSSPVKYTPDKSLASQENSEDEKSENINFENELETSQSVNSANNKSEIKILVNNYYNAISNKDYSEFYNLFSSNVNFFGKPNYSVDEIIIENNNYQNRWPYEKVNLDTNSFEVSNNGDKIIVRYKIFYKAKRRQEDIWKVFDLKMKMVLDQNLRIESISEYNK